LAPLEQIALLKDKKPSPAKPSTETGSGELHQIGVTKKPAWHEKGETFFQVTFPDWLSFAVLPVSRLSNLGTSRSRKKRPPPMPKERKSASYFPSWLQKAH
jgi:hypothetical protein